MMLFIVGITVPPAYTARDGGFFLEFGHGFVFLSTPYQVRLYTQSLHLSRCLDLSSHFLQVPHPCA